MSATWQPRKHVQVKQLLQASASLSVNGGYQQTSLLYWNTEKIQYMKLLYKLENAMCELIIIF